MGPKKKIHLLITVFCALMAVRPAFAQNTTQDPAQNSAVPAQTPAPEAAQNAAPALVPVSPTPDPTSAVAPQTPVLPAPAAADLAPTPAAAAPAVQATAQQQQPSVQAPAAATAVKEAQPSVVAGYGSEEAATGNLPISSGGMLPLTNPGMDMSINPDLVGGVDAAAGTGTAPTVLPYEEQLRIRTQEIQQKARDQGFEQIKKSTLPLETYEIRELLSRLRKTQEAIQTPIHTPPKPQNVVKTLSLDPSSTPLTIHLATGNISTISIVDVTGEPWPIVDLGFAGSFDVKAPEAGGNTLRMTPLKEFARGNLVLRLLKLSAPITFSLRAGQKTVNYRFDARVPQYGPNAKMPLLDTGIQSVAGDRVTTAVLEGVPPTGAKKLVVDGTDARTSAYRYAGSLYVRTPLSLLSPAWNGSATSADGMNVYVLGETPVLLLSDQGTLVRAHLAEATN